MGKWETAPRKAWKDTRDWLQNHILAWLLAFIVPGGGTVLATWLIPPSMDIRLAALYGFLGGIAGLLLLVGGAYAIQLTLVLKKQRDEARDLYSKLNIETANFKQERDTLRKELANQVKPSLPSHPYISDTYIKGKIIYLMDLFPPGVKPLISNRTIEDCEIRGPAMVILLGGVFMSSISFDGPDIDTLFVEIPKGRLILGAIGLQNCVFRRCHFIAIGIIGSHEQKEEAKKGFTQSKSDKEDSQT